MEIQNQNIPIYNFIFSSLKEKNNDIKENILLGNIKFPSEIKYSMKKNIFQTENHNLFLNSLSNQLKLVKINEEKNFLANKIEIADNKLNFLKKYNNSNSNIDLRNYYNKNIKYIQTNNSSNKKIIKNKSNEGNSSTLPLLKENNINKRNRANILEIKPIIRKTYKYNNKIMSNINEEDLEKNAKEFIKRINNNKINSISIKREKQQKDYLRLKKQIEIEEQKKKMREEFEYLRKNNENKDNSKKKNRNMININYKTKNNNNYIPNRNKELLKNYTDDIAEYNSQFYYEDNIPNSSRFHPVYSARKKNGLIGPIINDNYINERINSEPNQPVFYNINQNFVEFNPNIFNESQANNNSSMLNTSEKKHLYYFNELKYEN